VSPDHHVAALPARLLTPDEAEARLRARQPWADLWRVIAREADADRLDDPDPENDDDTADAT
jgi:hypothetical protein